MVESCMLVVDIAVTGKILCKWGMIGGVRAGHHVLLPTHLRPLGLRFPSLPPSYYGIILIISTHEASPELSRVPFISRTRASGVSPVASSFCLLLPFHISSSSSYISTLQQSSIPLRFESALSFFILPHHFTLLPIHLHLHFNSWSLSLCASGFNCIDILLRKTPTYFPSALSPPRSLSLGLCFLYIAPVL